MTERIYKEVKAKAELDQVDPRLKCDGYDRVIPPERLYLSETKKFIVNNGSYDLMVILFFVAFILYILTVCGIACISAEHDGSYFPHQARRAARVRRGGAAARQTTF